MTDKEQDLSESITNSVKKTINKKGAIGLVSLIMFGTVFLFSFYSNTNYAIESAASDRQAIRSSIDNMTVMVNNNQIGVIENSNSIQSVQETLERVIELQLLILEKID